MDIPISIQVFFEHNLEQKAIDHFSVGEWNGETEALLMRHILELLNAIKATTKSLSINLNVEVIDPVEASSILYKAKGNNSPGKKQKLSSREKEILNLISEGYTNNEIAKKLFISFETVKSHRKNILLKSHAKNTASLIHHQHLL